MICFTLQRKRNASHNLHWIGPYAEFHILTQILQKQTEEITFTGIYYV